MSVMSKIHCPEYRDDSTPGRVWTRTRLQWHDPQRPFSCQEDGSMEPRSQFALPLSQEQNQRHHLNCPLHFPKERAVIQKVPKETGNKAWILWGEKSGTGAELGAETQQRGKKVPTDWVDGTCGSWWEVESHWIEASMQLMPCQRLTWLFHPCIVMSNHSGVGSAIPGHI